MIESGNHKLYDELLSLRHKSSLPPEGEGWQSAKELAVLFKKKMGTVQKLLKLGVDSELWERERFICKNKLVHGVIYFYRKKDNTVN